MKEDEGGRKEDEGRGRKMKEGGRKEDEGRGRKMKEGGGGSRRKKEQGDEMADEMCDKTGDGRKEKVWRRNGCIVQGGEKAKNN